ncbi:MAG: hypothetical protein IKA85_00595 [Clostridia bacterium]|nr:hypothetical protein [Clostridia bacterium]
MKINNLKLKTRLKKLVVLIILAYFMLMLVIFPDKYVNSTMQGIKLWGLTVLPSLLPFFFLTQLLTATGVFNGISNKATKLTYPLFKCNGISAYTFLMSVLSGYPVGSRIVYDLKSNDLISKSESTKIGLLASTSGPLFIIGAVGIGMFNNKIIGAIIYISHIVSAILVGTIFRNYGNDENIKTTAHFKNKEQGNVLYNSIYNAVISSIIVGGFISVFYVFSEILVDTKILTPIEKIFEFLFKFLGGSKETSHSFTIGIIEATNGIKRLSQLENLYLTVPLSCALISFGGISIIMQSLIYLQKAEVKPLVFILGKLLQTVISFIICSILCRFFL